jgi:hypothetical protein
LLMLLVENYGLRNVLTLLTGMEKALDYQLFSILKLMEFVLDKKKDLLTAQETHHSTIITVVIKKTWLLDVELLGLNQNQNMKLVHLVSTGILLNGTKIILSLLLLLFGLEKNGEPFVMTILILMDKDLLMLLKENYTFQDVHLFKTMRVVLLDYQLFMMLKDMDFVLVKKKDSLTVQIVDTMIITVVILKMLPFIVIIQNQNQNTITLN